MKKITIFLLFLISLAYSQSNTTFVKLSGELKFIDENGKLMKASFNNKTNIYEMNKSYYSGTKFQLFIINNEPSYIYAFGFDSTLKTFTIFPHNNTSPYLSYKNATIAIPDENHYIQMDNRKGEDYFILLYSQEKLDIDKIKQTVENENRKLSKRLEIALGKSLIDLSDIDFENSKIKFQAKSKYDGGRTIKLIRKNSVVAVVVKFIHK